MRPTLTTASIADAGLVRLGAGMLRTARPALPPLPGSAVRFGAGMQKGKPSVADAGRVRLGAGMRRG